MKRKGRPPKEGICSDAKFEPDRDLYVALAIAESRASAATCEGRAGGAPGPFTQAGTGNEVPAVAPSGSGCQSRRDSTWSQTGGGLGCWPTGRPGRLGGPPPAGRGWLPTARQAGSRPLALAGSETDSAGTRGACCRRRRRPRSLPASPQQFPSGAGVARIFKGFVHFQVNIVL
jgi:hypothetical protein